MYKAKLKLHVTGCIITPLKCNSLELLVLAHQWGCCGYVVLLVGNSGSLVGMWWRIGGDVVAHWLGCGVSLLENVMAH